MPPGSRYRLFLHGRWTRVQLLWRSARGEYLLFAGRTPAHALDHAPRADVRSSADSRDDVRWCQQPATPDAHSLPLADERCRSTTLGAEERSQLQRARRLTSIGRAVRPALEARLCSTVPTAQRVVGSIESNFRLGDAEAADSGRSVFNDRAVPRPRSAAGCSCTIQWLALGTMRERQAAARSPRGRRAGRQQRVVALAPQHAWSARAPSPPRRAAPACMHRVVGRRGGRSGEAR